VKSGYSFNNWNTQADGNGVSYDGGESFSITDNTTLYAQWTANPTYSVTYDGNEATGGTVPTDSNKYEANTAVTVAGNTGSLVRSGYSFNNWNTQASGDGVSYDGGETFSITDNTTLYAQWTANPTYSVTYDGNEATGGSVPTDNNDYEANATVTVAGNTGSLVKTAYSFNNWNTQADGKGTGYDGGETFSITDNTTLYAQWTANPTYSVTYDGNEATGGSVPIDSNDYEANATVTVAGNTGSLVKSGYSFNNWNTQADGNGTNYSGGDTFSIGSSNVTLYARWTHITRTYTVTFDAWGGSPTPQTQTIIPRGRVSQPQPPMKSGYIFRGWYTSASFRTQWNFSAPVTRNMTLYAKWMPYDITVRLTGTKLVRQGHKATFTASVVVKGNSRITPTGTVTFYEVSAQGGNLSQLGEPVTLVRGKATLKPTDLGPGIHYIRAVFSDDNTLNSKTSNTFTVIIVR
jgi:uncharacterized repeat protein (TIGR02543 family)